MFGLNKKDRRKELKERLVLAAMRNQNCGDPVKWAKDAYRFICERKVISMKWRD